MGAVTAEVASSSLVIPAILLKDLAPLSKEWRGTQREVRSTRYLCGRALFPSGGIICTTVLCARRFLPLTAWRRRLTKLFLVSQGIQSALRRYGLPGIAGRNSMFSPGIAAEPNARPRRLP